MKNRKFQLDILKSLIREEIKLQKKKNLFEDVASTLDSAVGSTVTGGLGTPELKDPDKSTDGSGMTLYIININGYENFKLKGFDKYIKVKPIISKNPNKNSFIKVVYKLDSTAEEKYYKKLVDSMKFRIQTNPTDKSITLELYYDFDLDAAYKETYGSHYDFNKNFRIGYLHSGYVTTDEILDITLPSNIKFDIGTASMIMY
jgi:hypothetical protein